LTFFSPGCGNFFWQFLDMVAAKDYEAFVFLALLGFEGPMTGTIGLLDVGKRLMRFSSWEDGVVFYKSPLRANPTLPDCAALWLKLNL